MNEKQDQANQLLTAIVIGGTGLVGGEIIESLLCNDKIGKVVSLGRRLTGKQHPKLEEHRIKFAETETWAHLVKGDMLFSALGTTRSQAGSTEAQHQVDYTYQYQTAKAACENGVRTLVLVSSTGADAGSSFFYMRTKGELDLDVQAMGFPAVHILRPGPLSGPREKARMMEDIFVPVMRFFAGMGLFKKYRPISGKEVAKAAINCVFSGQSGNHIHEALDLFDLASK